MNSVGDVSTKLQIEPDFVVTARNEGTHIKTAFGEEFNTVLPRGEGPPRRGTSSDEGSSISRGNAEGSQSVPSLRSFRGREYEALPPATGGAPDTSSQGFVRSNSTISPRLLRFETVPEAAKFPTGPYRQAPDQHGGEWWLVNPFTGPQPWLRLSENNVAKESLPEGFTEAFGPRPTRTEIPDYLEFRQAKLEWEQELQYFKRTGMPEGLDPAKLEAAEQAFQEWGLGKPVFYEGRYGWKVRFPDGDVSRFQMNPETAVQAPHIVIAKYQIQLLQQGGPLDNPHPWVPPHLLTPGKEQA